MVHGTSLCLKVAEVSVVRSLLASQSYDSLLFISMALFVIHFGGTLVPATIS